MTLDSILYEWLGSMRTDVTRYVIFAVGVWLVLWVLLAKPMAGRKVRAEKPPARQLFLEFLFSIRSIAVFSTVGLATFFLERAGLLPGPSIAQAWGPVWFWVSLGLMIVAHDAWFYWTHRLIHDRRLFRRFHRRHHTSNNPSPFTAYSFDLGEAAINAAFVPLWMFLVPTAWPVTGLFMLHQIVRNTIGHSGYELFPASAKGRPLFDWMTTVTHHDLHHAQAGYNYGLYFTWWDRLMGTEHPDYYARFAQSVRKPRTQAGPAIAATIMAGALLVSAQPAHADAHADLKGDWATPGLGAVVRIEPCASGAASMCGALRWAWDPSQLSHVRPGGRMIEGLVHRDGAWRDGVLKNPEDGRLYRGEIKQVSHDVIRLRGCAGPLCRTQTWRRLSSIPRPD